MAEEVRQDPAFRNVPPDDLAIYKMARLRLKHRKSGKPTVTYDDPFLR